MGMFDFAKNAGAAVTAAQEAQMTEMFKAKLAEYGLHIKDLHVGFHEGVVTIKGEAPNRAVKEKIVLAVGNVAGVQKVDDQMTLPAPAPHAEVKHEPESQFYTVVKGDTLSKIAKHFYGDAMKYPQIFEANKPMLKSADLIYPGQVLRIPAL
jgi:nucleoid-associated protein YgaU